jgi:hypothetical protein
MKSTLHLIFVLILVVSLSISGKLNAQTVNENVHLVKITSKNIDHVNYININLTNKRMNGSMPGQAFCHRIMSRCYTAIKMKIQVPRMLSTE